MGIVLYENNMIMSFKQKEIDFKPRIKLNHNRDNILKNDNDDDDDEDDSLAPLS